jgi:hypothetical protein
MCPNILLKGHEIPFTYMEPPFVVRVGTMVEASIVECDVCLS